MAIATIERARELGGHGRLLCESCKKVIAQCRCPEGQHHVKFGLCDDCKAKEKPDAA